MEKWQDIVGNKFYLKSNPIKITKNGIKKSKLEIMTEFNLIIEKWIRKNPGQWLWLHRRW